jgi:hypothetical protein
MRSSASRSATWSRQLALGEIGLVWLGVLLGPIAVASALAGAAWGLAAGLAVGLVYLAFVLGAALLVRRSGQRRTDGPTPEAAEGPGGGPEGERSSRLLIAAGAAASRSEDLPAPVRSLIASADAILVMAPSLPGRLDWLTSATDRSQSKADHRLRTVLGHLGEMGADARGEVGADDPMQAFEDAVREFGPDHLLIGLRPEDREGWQEKGLIDRIEQRFAIPTTVFQL